VNKFYQGGKVNLQGLPLAFIMFKSASEDWTGTKEWQKTKGTLGGKVLDTVCGNCLMSRGEIALQIADSILFSLLLSLQAFWSSSRLYFAPSCSTRAVCSSHRSYRI